jgi:hypothetical protein
LVDHLTPGEHELTEAGQLGVRPVERAWDYWVRHIEKAGLMPKKAADKNRTATVGSRAKSKIAARKAAKGPSRKSKKAR